VTTNARTTQDLSLLQTKALSLHVVFMLLLMLRGTGRERHGLILRNIGRLVEEKKVRPLLDESCFTLETAPDAYRRLASGKARGKRSSSISPQ
jgi:NADPH2:quinone reductase